MKKTDDFSKKLMIIIKITNKNKKNTKKMIQKINYISIK